MLMLCCRFFFCCVFRSDWMSVKIGFGLQILSVLFVCRLLVNLGFGIRVVKIGCGLKPMNLSLKNWPP